MLKMNWLGVIPLILVYWLFSGLLARFLIRWVLEEFTKVLEKLEKADRNGADMHIFMACGQLEALSDEEWFFSGPFICPLALYAAGVIAHTKIFNIKPRALRKKNS